MRSESHALKLPYRLSVCGKNEIDAFSGKRLTHILSLEDPGTPQDTPSWFKGVHWQIQFHDVESIREAVEFGATAPTEDQVAEILGYGQECLEASRTRRVHLLVHCWAGASRSTAACYALLVQAVGVERASEALQYIRDIRPEAFPNQLIVKHADHLLGCRGELIRALAPFREDFIKMVEGWFAKLKRNEPP
jgi:predicted protein tyrosine phosphatase